MIEISVLYFERFGPLLVPLLANSRTTQITCQARCQDLEKGGGGVEGVRKVQTTLPRIFIVIESESHGLSQN